MLSNPENAGSIDEPSSPWPTPFDPRSIEAGELIRSTTRVPPALMIAGLAGLLLFSSVASALKQALPATPTKEAGLVQPEPERVKGDLIVRRTA